MPIHHFKCDECKVRVEDTTTMGIHYCPKCGGEMYWDCHISIGGNYDNPIHSDALAITPDLVDEHKREFPNIRLDGELRPIFDNYGDHKAYLKKTGFVKHTQKIRKKGTRIA